MAAYTLTMRLGLSILGRGANRVAWQGLREKGYESQILEPQVIHGLRYDFFRVKKIMEAISE